MLELVTLGMGNQEIADTLFLSINSVKTYIRTIYRKLSLASRPLALAWAIQHGFPAPEVPDAGHDIGPVTY